MIPLIGSFDNVQFVQLKSRGHWDNDSWTFLKRSFIMDKKGMGALGWGGMRRGGGDRVNGVRVGWLHSKLLMRKNMSMKYSCMSTYLLLVLLFSLVLDSMSAPICSSHTLVETSFSFNFILYGFIDPAAALEWRCTLSSLRILTVGCVVLANQATVECTHP